MTQLFPEQHEPPVAGTRVVAVAVNTNLWRTFDYVWPDSLGEPAVGIRVHVPFGKGNRKTVGFVTDAARPPGDRALKAVADVIDAAPRLDATLWRLGEWISQYYLSPLGMTLTAMIPSAVGRHAARTETVVFLAREPADMPPRLGARQRRVIDELLEARKQGIEPLSLEQLRRHSGASPDTMQRLRQQLLIRYDTRPVALPEIVDRAEADPFDLNAEQAAALAALEGKLGGGFSATLLYGVTGSGKTEVYVRAVRRVIEAGGQAILLVPEIALATQTLQRLLSRLPRVAVLHSGLTDAQRAFYYDQIASGQAAVVVGPRSAVFAPAPKLGLIVVDEEHEGSYKQDNTPRYHGRDVAIKRAQLAGVPVILGSATPSLESLHNVRQKRYDLLRLTHRVRGLPMPKLQIVNLREDMAVGVMDRLGRTLTHRVAAALDRREQVILLMNRRGYASYVFCPSCQWKFACDSCSRLMVFHTATQLGMCHYCSHTAAVPEKCPGCGKKLLYFGFGIQRIENELSRKFPAARVARMDSDTMTSPAQFRKVFDGFASGEVDILLGTQMVAKGLDFPRVSLVGVVSADTSLEINDFRASERTFQLIVQVAGRAGRADLPGEVVVQTLYEDEPVIQFASKHDYDGFAEYELPAREQTRLPPFSRMVRLVVRHENVAKAEEGAKTLAAALAKLLAGRGVRMMGPQPAAVNRIRNQFRFEVLLLADKPGVIQQVLGPRMDELSQAVAAEIVADADPMNLL